MQNKWLRIISLAAVAIGALALSKGKLVGAFILVVGIVSYKWLGRKASSLPEKSDFQLTDEMIVRFANLRGGIISANELALQTSLNVEQAKMRLEKLVQQEFAILRVSDSGNILYDFKKNHLGLNEKNSSEIV
jgi:hypothetical protein